MQAFWTEVGTLVTGNGRVDFMACDLAYNDNTATLNDLNLLLDKSNPTVTVAAATNTVGDINGASWTLEIGNVDVASVYFSQDALNQYAGTLNTFATLSLGGATGFDINSSGSSNVTDPTMVGSNLFFEATAEPI